MARNAVLTIILVCILGSIHHTTIFYVRFQNEIAPQTYLDGYTGVAEEEGVLQQSTNTTIVAANAADDDNENGRRAIVLVSMGGSEMNMVERFVWSLRNIGKYTGWIVLITDAKKNRYANLEVAGIPTLLTLPPKNTTFNDHHKFLVFRPAEKRFASITHFKKFSRTKAMNSKIFKTYILEYAQEDERLDSVDLFYYLDVDIVFGNTMQPFFDGLESTYRIGRRDPDDETERTAKDRSAKIYFFEGNGSKEIQGGQIVVDRTQSQPCLERWRALMQKNRSEPYLKDQTTLTQMLDEQRKRLLNATVSAKPTKLASECEIVLMEKKPEWIAFPELETIKNRTSQIKQQEDGIATNRPEYPSLVHFRNSAHVMKDVEEKELQIYLRDVLGFHQDQNDELGILNKMILGKKKFKK
jgi:hypothetical protein